MAKPTITRAEAYVPEIASQKMEREKGAEYGQAWLTSGRIVKMLAEMDLMDRILKSEFAYNWDIILNKLVRLLANPFKADSWRDIEVYAKLVADYLEAREPEKGDGER